MPTAEDFAFARLISYAAYQWPGYRDARHHRLIARKLEQVERGEIDRLMIFMPPRHGKSMLASEFFPAWYLGRNPDHYVVAATYGQELADDFGRKVKNQLAERSYQGIFPGVTLADDSKSSKRFHVNGHEGGFEHQVIQRGAYYAVGVGGPLTGRGAHLMLIDDPIKNREDADSEIVRKRLKDWYTSTAYTRLMPGGRIVVIQCMVGDTRVLMANGTESLLQDIAIGDEVATYDSGELKTSKVVNWVRQGYDLVYAIRTSSGIIVKANERHPFLVERNGSAEWIRLKELRAGDKMFRASIGANGAASPVPFMDARRLQRQRAIATPTTTKPSGPAVTEPRQSIQKATGPHTCGTDTASKSKITEQCLSGKTESAQSAASRRELTYERIGVASCASIMTTRPAGLEDCSATTAILPWAMERLRKCYDSPLTTYGIALDEIVSIEPAGREDVFDIQIAGTENFIANGLVSHNTRWHEDDLAGWLLQEHMDEGWDVLNLPALDTKDKALWPEQYDETALLRIKAAISSRDWSALYQQSPSPDEGTFFRREWFKTWTVKPKHLSIYGTSDYAVTDGGGDYTVHRIWGVDPQGDLYRLDGWRGQTTADVWIDKKLDLISRYKPFAWFGESGVIQKAIEPMLKRRMLERKTFCRMEWLPSISDKPTRARGFQARAASGRVYFEPGADIDEHLKFPAGKNDDDVDNSSLMGRALDDAHPAIVPVKEKPLSPDHRWDKAFSETELNDWKTV